MCITKANRTGRASFRRYVPFYVLLLLGILNQTSHGNVVPAHTQFLTARPPLKSLFPQSDLPSAVTVSIDASQLPDGGSGFYLRRIGGFDRTLSVTLELSGTAPGRADRVTITTFVTFLPGEKEQLVTLQSILQNHFTPEHQVSLRIVPSSTYLSASSGEVKI